MKDFLENYDLLFAMTVLTAITILLKCICAIVYQVLLRDSEQITATKNKWIRSMCTRFEACYKLKIPIHNPSCFVENYMEDYRFLGISMRTLENTDWLCAMIITASALLSIMCGIFYELPVRWVLIHSMTLVFFLIFLATAEFIFQVRRKRKLLHLQLLNYFENTLQAKLENQYLHPEEQKAYQNAYFEDEAQEKEVAESDFTKKEKRDTNTADSSQPAKDKEHYASEEPFDDLEESYASSISPDMQELIDSLLEESKITEELKQQQEKLHTAATTEKFRLVEEIMKEYL